MAKHIERKKQDATAIFDHRNLTSDYRTLLSALKTGIKVLDVGCGTGAISRDIAEKIGHNGKVIGIDKAKSFIDSGRQSYKTTLNLELIHSDLFEFEAAQSFDLIVAARALQWMPNPKEALQKMKTLLKPGGQISILDYNHADLEWLPNPPDSMIYFYKQWLKWRADAAGLNNRIAADMPRYFEEVGLSNIEVFNSDEIYTKGNDNFDFKVGIWSKVAASTQIAREGYIKDIDRLKAIEEYNDWVNQGAEQMTMKLCEVRGILKI